VLQSQLALGNGVADAKAVFTAVEAKTDETFGAAQPQLFAQMAALRSKSGRSGGSTGGAGAAGASSGLESKEQIVAGLLTDGERFLFACCAVGACFS
jgi:hypothetical protein